VETIRELFDGWASAELTFEVALSFSGKLDFVSDRAREAIELSEVVKDSQTNHFGGVRFKLDVSCGIKMIDAFDQTNYTCADISSRSNPASFPVMIRLVVLRTM
jgi:hypothetical protein